MQSSYAKGVNKQQDRTGNLFQQKTKAKLVSGDEDYSITAFHYIHHNPVAANLVGNPEEWTYSSFQDYIGLRNGTLCNKKKGVALMGLSAIDLKTESRVVIAEEIIKKIY